jgi:simple sugar transport system permease protein
MTDSLHTSAPTPPQPGAQEQTQPPEAPTGSPDGHRTGAPSGGPGERLPVARSLLNAVLEGSNLVVTILAFFAAIVVGGLIIAFTDPDVLHEWASFFYNPGTALGAAWHSASSAYIAMFKGAIFDPATVSKAFSGGSISAVFGPLSETVVQGIPLILAGIAVALPFKAGLFNIGGTGQIVFGALLSGYIGFALDLPPVLHVALAVVGGFVGGAAVGWFVGFLKARTGAHEVIVTIMFNYIARFLLLYLLGLAAFRRPGRLDPISPFVHGTARLPHLLGSSLRIHAGFLLALAIAGVYWWIMNRSTLGFEFRAVGLNPDAARTAGMNVPRSFTMVMLIAGGFAGLAGATIVLGTDFTITPDVAGMYGIDAITVALLGRGQPFGTVLAALLFGALRAGGVTMQAATNTPVDIVTVIQSLIVLFVAAPALIREVFRLRGARAGMGGETLAKGWGS